MKNLFIACFLFGSMVVCSQAYSIEPFSEADDVTNLINTLKNLITTGTANALSSFNTYTSQLATLVSTAKSSSLNEYNTFIASLNRSVIQYEETTKGLDVDMTACTSNFNSDVSALIKDQLEIIKCVDQESTNFETTRNNAENKFNSLSEEITELQIQAQVCFNDEFCLLGVKQTCTKMQRYLPFQIQLYSDEVAQEFTGAKAQVTLCSSTKAAGIKGTDILKSIITCISDKVDAAAGPTPTPEPTPQPTTLKLHNF